VPESDAWSVSHTVNALSKIWKNYSFDFEYQTTKYYDYEYDRGRSQPFVTGSYIIIIMREMWPSN